MTTVLSSMAVLAAEAGAAGGAGPAASAGGGLGILVPMIAIFALWMFMTQRSQKKRQRERQNMLDEIRPRDDVTTIGGIRGRVIRVEDDTLVLRVDPDKDVKITIAKTGISRKVGDEESNQ